ncbi:golgin subfamily B member 1-like [Punica granatum]|uniref:DUF7653 domain-containing protein n=2 Tax=Punica granatum TaxID=22663 RepID=A0A218WC84_PUNGR|nr:golgin subfamily B member 1-like [Punica granatum]XP_031379725.1 golgin subfamily B member 1-like [Punica granatum]OWM70119.1 hypothetical protein CDL15_Pgr025969 [Punica granatum]PKI32430.1 hypothetical protein CRG98_047193 [Punica granatum]
MKKLFFFRSSGSSNTTQPLTEKTNKEDLFENGLSCPIGQPRKHSSDSQSSNAGSGLRRSLSLSSASFFEEGFEQSNSHENSCRVIITPEKQSRTKRSSRSHNDSSGNSSNCSSNVSSKIIDRYIDGEQNQDRSRPKNIITRNQAGKDSGNRPPRAQFTAPSSPVDSAKTRPRSHSFRESKGTRLYFSSRDWVEGGLGHESPRRLAKNVIERLSQTTADFPRASSKEFDHDIPITIEDIYSGSLNKDSSSEAATRNSSPLDEPYETIGCEVPNHKCAAIDEEMDFELQRRYKVAEEKVALLSEEFERDRFVLGMSFDVSALIHTIRSLSEERMSLATEISELLQSRIAERASAKEELRLVKVEMELQLQRLEREKKELQVGLEKELDRRSNGWSSRLEKYQFEEQRLRERVRELAEQNVSLQREVSSFGEREAESRNLITYSEQQIKELSMKVEESTWQNEELHRHLSELREKCKAAEESEECIKRNFQEKEKECKELHRSVTRLLRTANEQEKTIEGLRDGFCEDDGKLEKVDKQVAKLRMEQMRLTGVELALRKEVESHRLEAESLRHENINLLSRLKGNSKDPRDSMFQLDNELWARVCCLQSQGLSLLNETTDLCSKLLALVKEKSYHEETKQGIENVGRSGLDSQFIIESDVKIQGFKRGMESLARSLQTISRLLQEKVTPLSTKQQLNDQTSEDALRSELKAESLVTSLLREKLYSKEMEVEQLRAELATAVRSTDVLRYEVQNALDSLSCVTHKLRELELQMLKKDESMNRLQSDLQDSKRELNVIRGILPKVMEERDKMWEKVKDFSEKNMLLNSEVEMLRKRIDTLDEDIHIKEGEITILKDSISKKSFDLLSSPDFTREFLLE